MIGTISPSLTLNRSSSSDLYLLNLRGQEQWEKGMKDVLQVKERQVAVLLTSWENNDDSHSLNTTKELSDLTNVFESKYNFNVQTALLNTQSLQPPKYQMNSILNKFLTQHDQPGTLLIVYYGGHGVLTECGEDLRLMGRNPSENDRSSTELNWTDVEPILYRLRADLLLIFDCCYAGLVARNKRTWPESKSHFEFVASTAFDKPARGPKSAGSFTRAMINALDNLAQEEEFTSTMLVDTIVKSKVFRETLQQPFVSTCGKSNVSSRLLIRPKQKSLHMSPAVESQNGKAVNFYLHLECIFREKPSPEHIKKMTESFEEMAKNGRVPITNISWSGLTKYRPRMRVVDAARKLHACLGYSNKRARHDPESSERLGICRPEPVLKRTLTTLTIDDGRSRTTTTHKAEFAPHTSSKAKGVSHFSHRIRNLLSFIQPHLRWMRLLLFLLALTFSAAFTFSRWPNTIWSYLLK